jgi:hypothetical protein
VDAGPQCVPAGGTHNNPSEEPPCCYGTSDEYGHGICEPCGVSGELIDGYSKCFVNDAGENQCIPLQGLPGLCCPGLTEEDEKVDNQPLNSVVCE